MLTTVSPTAFIAVSSIVATVDIGNRSILVVDALAVVGNGVSSLEARSSDRSVVDVTSTVGGAAASSASVPVPTGALVADGTGEGRALLAVGSVASSCCPSASRTFALFSRDSTGSPFRIDGSTRRLELVRTWFSVSKEQDRSEAGKGGRSAKGDCGRKGGSK